MAAWAAGLSGLPHITFDDTEHARFEHLLYLPFTSRVYTPDSFTKDMGKKQVRYPGYHELAYLHPNWFTPDPGVLEKYGLKVGEPFFVIRQVSWNASHDLGQKGFGSADASELIALLKKYGKVVLSSELKRETEVEETGVTIDPAHMHDLLYYSTLYVGEGGTMATEAALLGTPAIFVSTLTAGNWQDLENNYGLMFSLKESETAKQKVVELLNNPDLKKQWSIKRQTLLEGKIDVTEYLVAQIEKSGELAHA